MNDVMAKITGGAYTTGLAQSGASMIRAPQPPSPLSELEASILIHNEALTQMVSTLNALNDRLFGVRPVQGQTASLTPLPANNPGRLESLDGAVRYTGELIKQLREQIAQLDSLA